MTATPIITLAELRGPACNHGSDSDNCPVGELVVPIGTVGWIVSCGWMEQADGKPVVGVEFDEHGRWQVLLSDVEWVGARGRSKQRAIGLLAGDADTVFEQLRSQFGDPDGLHQFGLAVLD